MLFKDLLRPTKHRVDAGIEVVRRERFRRSTAKAFGVDATISSSDDMYYGDPQFYFEVGASAWRAIERGLASADASSPRRILDFACGHGRVMRFMRAEYPDAELAAADIDHDGVRFCARTFGASGLPTDGSMKGVIGDGAHDLIWSGSLLTHFDHQNWPGALQFFRDNLSAKGVLIFSVHGQQSADLLAGNEALAHRLNLPPRYGLSAGDAERMAEGYERDGFGFHPWPNADFGLSVSSRRWVEDQLASGGWRVARYDEAAWGDHHDVVTCTIAEGIG